ncbi:MAG: hypothetical protein NXH85_14565 [Pseudomonadaceae bacterium]|nr:hypothetical protein [Pseudomonadaceae bacterium]
MNTRIFRILPATCALVISAGCTATYTPTFSDTSTLNLAVSSKTPQQEMTVQFVEANSSAVAGAQGGALGALIGAAIDAGINQSRAKKAEAEAEVVRRLLPDVQLQGKIEAALAELPESDNFAIVTVRTLAPETKTRDHAREVLSNTEIDAVIATTHRFTITSDLNKVEVSALAEIYLRKPNSANGSIQPPKRRVFTYVSESQGMPRGWDEGEKEAHIKAIETSYRSQIAETDIASAARQRLVRSRDNEIRRIKRSTTVSRDLALESLWTSDELLSEINRGASHIAKMIAIDLSTREATDGDMRTADRLPITAPTGVAVILKGQFVKKIDGHEIFRADSGDLYSVPSRY